MVLVIRNIEENYPVRGRINHTTISSITCRQYSNEVVISERASNRLSTQLFESVLLP